MKLQLRPFAAVIALLTVVLLTCCKQNQEIVPSTKFAPYISAYTGGVISSASPIVIQLTNELPAVELDAEFKNNPFSFTPSLKGKTRWINNKTICFEPDPAQLKAGVLYNAQFNLKEFVDVDKSFEKFPFSFRVMPKSFKAEIMPINVSASSPQLVTIEGELLLNDVTDLETVRKMITARSKAYKNLSVDIKQGNKPSSYVFRLDSIEKQAEEATIQLKIDGKPYELDKQKDEKIVIPAINSFNYVGLRKIHQPENGLELTFSEPVSDTQDITGLISIPEITSYVTQVKENKVYVYFETKKSGLITIHIDQGLKNYEGKNLNKETTLATTIEDIKPSVAFTGDGTIMPDSKNLILPFKAVNLKAVDLQIIRIFESNVLQFLQENTLDTSNQLRRYGRLVYKSTLNLFNDPEKDLYSWDDYSIDLTTLIEQEPGAIYRIILSFKQDYSLYSCGGVTDEAEVFEDLELPEYSLTPVTSKLSEEDDAEWDTPNSYYNPEYQSIDWDVYEWDQTSNPCHPSYFMGSNATATCNVLASNLGIIAKANAANKLWVSVSDIVTTDPVAGAEVSIYNYQLQLIGSGQTDEKGFATITCQSGKPFVLVASKDKQKSYLRLLEGESNLMNRFDVGGKQLSKGLKGFIYGERGVWRPGDTLHIGFMVEDAENRLPENHPVSFEIYNPRGQFYTKQVQTKGENGLYVFHIPTSQDDPTGLWNGYVKLGGATFHKAFRIETIKPNRLKVNLKLPHERIDAQKGNFTANIHSSWLTGATAGHLATKVEMSISKVHTAFKGYEEYQFNNPATSFVGGQQDLFDGTLDANGDASFTFNVPAASNAPGMLQAHITTRVFEQGGDASIVTQSVPFSPFNSYVGIQLMKKDQGYLETDVNNHFRVVTLNPDGKPISRNGLSYKIYNIGWSWWWETRSESFDSYINNSSYKPVKEGTLDTKNGLGGIDFRIDYPSWGRYLVYVKDPNSGHATGGTVYIDWPEWRGRAQKADPSGITMLTFSTDKAGYEVGETATVTLPPAASGRALVAIENGSTVLQREWVKVADSTETKYSFKVTEEMAPNAYIHISLLQPHAQTINDLPIRRYGVQPLIVNNKSSILTPLITMPDVLRPEEAFNVSVKEQKGRTMSYTLAIVDDGLLDLTNFKTPDPWADFYAREALGILTWDMFDEVMGALKNKGSSLFSVGGDEELKPANNKANRFKPVVKYLGPFTLKKGETKTHTITLPPYVGSVRTMVVASDKGAYGNAEKTTPVRTPLMILSSLPRVASVNEEIMLPVNIFAMESSVTQVTVQVETTGKFKLNEGSSRKITFNTPGDQMVYFPIMTGSVVGKETVKITATGGGKKATETIEIDVRNPNPVSMQTETRIVKAGETIQLAYELNERNEDNWVKADVSRLPSLDISRRFDFLYNYQHYCTEQLTSRALPMLFLPQFKDMDNEESEKIKTNVTEAIKNLYGRQLSNGSFVYWPGNREGDDWITSYVGVFLMNAKEKGYEVNTGIVNRWKAYQSRVAQNWRQPSSEAWYRSSQEQAQAFRLYSLALAGTPEMGAMNRLREQKGLSLQSRWMLASAYALTGKNNIAGELVFNAETNIDSYQVNYHTYGTSQRDEAIILEALVLMGRSTEMFRQAQKVSRNLANESYFSTQSTAFALMAMGKLSEKMSGTLSFDWELNGKKQADVRSAKNMVQLPLSGKELSGKIALTNKGKGDIYVDLTTRTRPMSDTLPAVANNLEIKVRYADIDGNTLDISSLKQGKDFYAYIDVSNISGSIDYTNLALSYIIPSGWEIFNERMTREEGALPLYYELYTYQDIRDDRVLTYFDLRRSKSQTFRVRLQATYAGHFTLPATFCEGMYDTSAQARTTASKVKVVNK